MSRFIRTAAVTTALAALGMLLFSGAALAQDDLNCSFEDFDSKADAQATLDANPDDPHNLDADNDGEACDDGLTGEPPADNGATTDTEDDQVDDAPAGGAETGGGGTADGGTPLALIGLGVFAVAGLGAFGARRLSVRSS